MTEPIAVATRQCRCRLIDWRHLKTLGWMVSALIGSGKLSLSAWEPSVTSQATQAQSFEWKIV